MNYEIRCERRTFNAPMECGNCVCTKFEVYILSLQIGDFQFGNVRVACSDLCRDTLAVELALKAPEALTISGKA